MPGAISATANGVAAGTGTAQTSASSSDAVPSDAVWGRKRLFRSAERHRLGGLLRILLAAHPAVDEGRRRVVRRGDRLDQAAAIGREMADRVGGRGVTGQRE